MGFSYRSRRRVARLRQTDRAARIIACPQIAMLDIERVDFVSVPTRDVARARRFYADVLGLPPSAGNPDEFETPNVTLALWQPEAEGLPFAPNTAGIALRVPDVEAARERLTAHGVEFLGDTVDTGVCLMGFFYDPDGNVLILHRRYAPH
jgi:catechol 2,3-dioxygenase-like lactoylglutathione lyase family enzyme